MTDLYSLPWQIQLALASGYAAYLLAFVGTRSHHRAIDVTFLTLLFGLITTATLALLPDCTDIESSLAAFGVTILAALFWRKWGYETAKWILRALNISWSDDSPSAWATFARNTKYPISQVAVLLDDGTWLRCDEAGKFVDAPHGAVILGTSGDVAMYLTHEELSGQNAKILTTVRNADWGDRMTYIPASRIQRVTLRFKADA